MWYNFQKVTTKKNTFIVINGTQSSLSQTYILLSVTADKKIIPRTE